MTSPIVFIALGALFFAGLAADQLGRLSRMPRVTLLLLCGIAVGEAGFDVIPAPLQDSYGFLSIAALTMVAFLMGGTLSAKMLWVQGREILITSLAIVLATLAIVAGGLALAGVPLALALVLAALATATDPAATQDAIAQSGRETGFTRTLQGVVAVDDAWGLIAFSVVLVLAGQIMGQASGPVWPGVVRELGGAVLLGLAVGLPAAFLTGRLREGEPLAAEALGLVFLTAGLALWCEVSYLIAGMTAGAVIVNRAHHHTRAFHEIAHFEWPFMILFFVMAGASLDPTQLLQIGALGVGYVVLRVIARILGGMVGGTLARSPAAQRHWIGAALLPQAGVAVGMALVAAERFPQWGDLIMTLTIGATVLFEVAGPILTLYAIRRVDPS